MLSTQSHAQKGGRMAPSRKRIEQLEEHIPHLRRYARHLTKNFEQADDMVQDCLLRAIENIDKWQPGTNMRAWLIVILRNNFFNHCRRARRENEIKFDPGLVASNFSPAAQVDWLSLGELTEAFGELSEDHRDVINRIVMDGLSYEDAAAELGISVGTVKSRLSRARGELRHRLDGDVVLPLKAVARGTGVAGAKTSRGEDKDRRRARRETARIAARFAQLLSPSAMPGGRRPAWVQ